MRPVRYARIGGALLTRDQLIVPNDAVATADNIAGSPELWRLGIAVDVVMQLCDVPVMLILFRLLSPVNRNVALLALLFNIVQTATLVANQLTLVAAQLLSTEGLAARSATPEERRHIYLRSRGSRRSKTTSG